MIIEWKITKFCSVTMALLILLILPSSFQAEAQQIYSWKDANGKVHFGDAKNKPGDVQADELQLKINTYESVTVEAIGSGQSAPDHQKVVMYSASWCGYCKQARQYFRNNRIRFIEYDIEKDKRANKRYEKMGANGVPVILYKQQRMNGFSEERFEAMYSAGNNPTNPL